MNSDIMDSDILLKLVADTGILDTDIPISIPSQHVAEHENEPNWNTGIFPNELAVKSENNNPESSHMNTPATLNSEERKFLKPNSNQIVFSSLYVLIFLEKCLQSLWIMITNIIIAVDNILAGVIDANTCQQEPEEQQILPEAPLQPYLKIIEEPGDTRFRYF